LIFKAIQEKVLVPLSPLKTPENQRFTLVFLCPYAKEACFSEQDAYKKHRTPKANWFSGVFGTIPPWSIAFGTRQLHPIVMTITMNRERTQMYTGLWTVKSKWNNKYSKVIGTDPESKLINDTLLSLGDWGITIKETQL
jgi:hypothetical protein